MASDGDKRVITISEMNALSLADASANLIRETNERYGKSWDCTLYELYELAVKLHSEKDLEIRQLKEGAISSKLNALCLQASQGQCDSNSINKETESYHCKGNDLKVPIETIAVWQSLHDMPKETAMQEFVQLLDSVTTPLLKSYAHAYLEGADKDQRMNLKTKQLPLKEAGFSDDGASTEKLVGEHSNSTNSSIDAGASSHSEATDGAIDDSAVSDSQGVIQEGALWTIKEIKEFKDAVKKEAKQSLRASSVVKVGSGETVTVRVPTHRGGCSLFWEFATDSYDIAFGIYFEWNESPPEEVQVVVSDSSDEDEDSEFGAAGDSGTADPEKGSGVRAAAADLGLPVDEIIPIFRRNCHEEVHCGSHAYPGTGVYLLKFDNSYSLWRSKTLYYKIYCA